MTTMPVRDMMAVTLEHKGFGVVAVTSRSHDMEDTTYAAAGCPATSM
jgi:hypothetical protein